MRVMYVEDDQDYYALIRAWLDRSGHECMHAATIPEAAEHIEGVDLMLLDWELGDVSGAEVMADPTIRASSTPVVVVSGYDAGRVDEAAFDAGAVAFLTKGELNAGLLDRTARYALRVSQPKEAKTFDMPDTKLALGLVRGDKVADAAAEAGMAVRTAYRRIADPDFQAFVTSLKERMAEELIERALREI